MKPKGHHQRGYLPHRDYGSAVQAITFREADSLPTHVIEKWKSELIKFADSNDQQGQENYQKELSKRIAHYEDAGHGNCHLRTPRLAQIVQNSLLKGHGENYKLIAWCIMPNHVHVLIKQAEDASLGEIVRLWKGSSAHQINQALGKTGAFWSKDYFDRVIRDEDHFWNAIAYIHKNPERAGLVDRPEDWLFSSLGHGWTP